MGEYDPTAQQKVNRLRPLTDVVDAAVDQLRDKKSGNELQAGAAADGQLLFFGNWHESIPKMLLSDPVLSAGDKLVWQLIKQEATANGATAMPSYKRIQQLANLRSEATVSRSLAMLRISRWLTKCQTVRAAQGSVRGNVYAIHDEPIDLVDMLELDKNYMKFLQHAATGHHHNRVRHVAQMALQTMSDDIERGKDIMAHTDQFDRRAQAHATMAHKTSEDPEPISIAKDTHFYAFNFSVLEQDSKLALVDDRLQKIKSGQDGNIHSLQKMKSAGTAGDNSLHNLKSGTSQINEVPDAIRSSSSFLNIDKNNKETTTTPRTPIYSTDTNQFLENLIVGERISEHLRPSIAMVLAHIPEEHQQMALWELEGRVKNADECGKPVRNQVSYLQGICNKIRSGEFVPSHALRIQAAHEAKLAQKRREAMLDEEAEAQRGSY